MPVRLHHIVVDAHDLPMLDLTSSAEDRDDEIRRLLALGARPVDVGQAGAES